MSKKYSEKERHRILARYAAGRDPVATIIAEEDIARSNLYNWTNQLQKAVDDDITSFTPANFNNLKKKALHLEGVVAVLKESD